MANGIAAEDEDVGGMTPPWKRRRGGEIGRDWKCDVDDCDKDFKSVSIVLMLFVWFCSTC